MNELKVTFKESEPKYISIYNAYKNAIETGILSKEDKLPSKRKLSVFLGVSLNTVMFAYSRLEDEEYIYSKEKKGYYVVGYRTYNKRIETEEEKDVNDVTYDFTSENIDFSIFPSYTIRKIVNEITLKDTSCFIRKTPKKGDIELRKTISFYLYENKGMTVDYENCIIVSSFEESLEILSKIMEINHVGCENPGYPKVYDFFNDKNIYKFNVDEDGIKLDSSYDLDLLYLTPYNQFPCGCKMSHERRIECLNYKAKYILEDDFDCDLIRRSKRISTLYTLNSEKVIYHGSFNHTICPGLRIGYLILPNELKKAYDKTLNIGSSRVSTLDQMILLKFLKEGYYYRNVGKMKRTIEEKMNLAYDVIKSEFDRENILSRTYSFVLKMDEEMAEKIRKNIKNNNLKAHFINDYSKDELHKNELIISILSIPLEEVKKAIELLIL